MAAEIHGTIRSVVLVGASLFLLCIAASAQTPPPKTILLDHDGNRISDNEFVDIRMANFQYPDATIVKVLPDGTTEMRVQKIPQEGMAAPAFSVRTVDGRTLDSADLKGKVVVLDLWFIGCPACLNIEPKLNAFKARFAGNDGVVFLAMTPDSVHEVKKYLAKQPFDFIHGVDAEAAIKAFVFNGYPKNIVIGRDGTIVYWRSTIHAWDKFESVVRAELDKN